MPILDDLAGLATPIDQLELLPGNPRRGDVAAVARSLEAFGQRKPIVARRSDNVVIAGNHTLLAARSLGWTEIAVAWTDDDETTAKAYALADNRTAELGDYDDAALAELIAAVQVEDADLLAATGWTPDDLIELIRQLEAGEPEPGLNDEDDIPESAPPLTVPGDVWLLGPHRVMCGDATSPTDVEKLMAGDPVDCVWTDPPYGVSYVGKTKDALTIDNDGAEGLPGLLAGAFASYDTVMRPGAAFYVAHPAGPHALAFAQAVANQGWRLHETLVWVKDSMVLGHSDYHYRHEPILYGYKPGKGRWGRGAQGWYGDDAQTSVLEVARPKASPDHPTGKPVELISRCLLNSSRRGEVVADLFGGSGSTLISAHSLGRRSRLMEIDPRYVDVICRRYQEHTGEKPIAESSGQQHDFTVAA